MCKKDKTVDNILSKKEEKFLESILTKSKKLLSSENKNKIIVDDEYDKTLDDVYLYLYKSEEKMLKTAQKIYSEAFSIYPEENVPGVYILVDIKGNILAFVSFNKKNNIEIVHNPNPIIKNNRMN